MFISLLSLHSMGRKIGLNHEISQDAQIKLFCHLLIFIGRYLALVIFERLEVFLSIFKDTQSMFKIKLYKKLDYDDPK